MAKNSPTANTIDSFVNKGIESAGLIMNEDGEEGIEIDLNENEDEQEYGSDGYEMEFEGHYENLVYKFSEQRLMEIGLNVNQETDEDNATRKDWLDTIDLGLKLLGIQIEQKSEPFEGACSAQHPLLMENAVKFQSKASSELLPSDGPVKTKVLGDITPEREQQAVKIQKFMNYQITEEMTEYYPDTERLLFYLALIGSAFKKTYFSTALGRPVSEFVPADQLVVKNSESDLFRASRFTHILHKSKHDLTQDFYTGFYTKPDDFFDYAMSDAETSVKDEAGKLIGHSVYFGEDRDYILHEQYVYACWDELEENNTDSDIEIYKPYVVTVDKNTGCVLSIRRNWNEGDKRFKKKVPFSHWSYVPGMGFYCYGLLHLLGNLQLALTSSLRSLVDAGQFANLQGGFKLKGVRISGDNSPIAPGEFKDLEATMMDISKAIMPLPFKEPSQTLFQLLSYMNTIGQKFADSTEQVIADSTNYGPVGTTLALLDASTKFFASLHKRLHAAQKYELRLIAEINGESLEDDHPYNEINVKMSVNKTDFDRTIDIVPVSDPNIPSNAHRMAKAQAMLDIALKTPEQHDMQEVLKHVYINMDYADVDRILIKSKEAVENDPVTDIQLAIQGKPIKAFPGQDHSAHINIKQAFLQDPNSGASPFMAKAKMIISSNIQEHMFLQFVEQVQAQSEMDGSAQAEAAKKVAMLNQQKLQAELEAQKDNGTDKAAMMLAEAEMLQEQTQARKQTFDEKHKAAQLVLAKEKLEVDKMKEFNRLIMNDKKLALDFDKFLKGKGIDLVAQALTPNNSVDK